MKMIIFLLMFLLLFDTYLHLFFYDTPVKQPAHARSYARYAKAGHLQEHSFLSFGLICHLYHTSPARSDSAIPDEGK